MGVSLDILETFKGFTRHFGEVLAENPDLITCYEDECKEGDESVVRRFFIDIKAATRSSYQRSFTTRKPVTFAL